MKDISFFSEDTYLSIPNRENPKVILAIGNKYLAKNSFKIYNPFSTKAKLFKSIVRFFTVNFNNFFLHLLSEEIKENSEFINFLNNEYKIKFNSSIYNATLKDKVVVQLQTDGSVFGYVKFPLNEMGLKNISNEIYALETLKEKGILNLQMKSLKFKGIPFFILPELKGNISKLSDDEILRLLEPYKKDISLKLKDQERVKEIKEFLIQQNLKNELVILENALNKSNEYYYEVYEHGDFAPWNIVKTKEGLVPFDFEYFTERGVEYFDLIKYHFQVGRLLQGKNQEDLYMYISQKILIKEIKQMLSLYLLKEIMSAFQQQKSADFESQMLILINA